MKNKLLLCLLFSAAFTAISTAATPTSDAPKTVVIIVNDSLKFSVTHIEARPGQTLHIELRNAGTIPKTMMGHNWILLKANKDIGAYAGAAAAAAKDGYEPKALANDVLASIRLLGPKESADVTFTAPSIAGRYEYLCSFPGHSAAGMHGELVVK
jgi:azurin